MWPKRGSGGSPPTFGMYHVSVSVSRMCRSLPPPTPPKTTMFVPSAVAEWRERGDGSVPWTTGLSHVRLPTWSVCTSLNEIDSSPPAKMYRCIPMSTIEWPFRGDGAVPNRCGCAHVSAYSIGSSGSTTSPPPPRVDVDMRRPPNRRLAPLGPASPYFAFLPFFFAGTCRAAPSSPGGRRPRRSSRRPPRRSAPRPRRPPSRRELSRRNSAAVKTAVYRPAKAKIAGELRRLRTPELHARSRLGCLGILALDAAAETHSALTATRAPSAPSTVRRHSKPRPRGRRAAVPPPPRRRPGRAAPARSRAAGAGELGVEPVGARDVDDAL